MRLMREVRFSLLPPGSGDSRVTNSWGGWPGDAIIAPYLILRAVVSGPVDPVSGYLCNITVVDRLMRDHAIPLLQARYREAGGGVLPVPPLLTALRSTCMEHLHDGVQLEELHLSTTPYLSFSIPAGGSPMIAMTQSFEFSASHRLHCPELSEEENRRTFGKCNNPAGHGHNYRVDVTVEGAPDEQTGVVIELPTFESIVKERVLDALDHKHLNTDCSEFASVNPSVENITRIIWEKLDGAFPGCRLARVRVWETPKTWAEYGGD
jgi:6-pyruvoyltetrahydropterin/6-carboxytetrahydropterin synthase